MLEQPYMRAHAIQPTALARARGAGGLWTILFFAGLVFVTSVTASAANVPSDGASSLPGLQP